MRSSDYKDRLFEDLKDREYAAGYLTACYEEGPDTFLLGVRDVTEAHGGMRALADKAELNRENLYDMLSDGGNPRLSSLASILGSLGFGVEFKPARSAGKRVS